MDLTTAKADFARDLRPRLEPLRPLPGFGPARAAQIDAALGAPVPNLWEVANLLGAAANEPSIAPEAKAACFALIGRIREAQGEWARMSAAPTTVVFGTSGWREAIGEGFTILNVHKVVRGIVEMMRTRKFLDANRYLDFDAVRAAGVLVFRDNRYMGDEFMAAAMHELAAAGVQVYLAGECPTGVGSALVVELGCAGSINFTPSHNPMEYAGIKFNPRDGGPADVDLTSLIEEKANAYMRPGAEFRKAGDDYAPFLRKVDAAGLFTRFVEEKSQVFDLRALRAWLRARKTDLHIAVDNMHGSSRGYIQRLLGEDLVRELADAGALRFLNTGDDYAFHGVKPEPSAKNQAPLIALLRASGRPLTLAAALDPDADRIRYADAAMDIDMNRFGAIAYANLLAKGLRGGIASTAPSSDFALEIAKREGQEVFETAVGFKHFREPLSSGRALVAFEESDGISFRGHTLEKCAIGGFLAALDCMARSGRNLSELYGELRARYGWFYPDKAGADVKGVSVGDWQRYKRAVVGALEGGMFRPGDRVPVGAGDKAVQAVNTIDGLKLIFADRSWILLRASGTEPKFRYYYEVVAEGPLADPEARLAEYREAAAAILERARSRFPA